MGRLTWTQRDHGWRAGPYEVELVAPQLWVCTRRRRSGVSVEMTSGSLSALKARVETMESRRRSIRGSVVHGLTFLLSMAAAAVAASLDMAIAPTLVIGFSIVGVRAALKGLDCVVRRSWESLSLNYQ